MFAQYKIEKLLKNLKSETDQAVIDEIGRQLWDLTEEIIEQTKPEKSLLQTLLQAINSKVSNQIINNALIAIAHIGGEEAEKILENVKGEYGEIDDGVSYVAGKLLVMLNPEKYFSFVDQETLVSALFQLARKNKLAGFEVVLKENPAGVNLANEIGMTLMWAAIDNNSLELCKLLLLQEIDLDLKNAYDENVIEYANKKKNETSEYLLKACNA